MKLNLIKAGVLVLGILGAGIYVGCQPEKFSGEGNGLTPKSSSPSFTITPISGKPNNFILKANPQDVLFVNWDLGDGGGSNPGKTVDTVFLPDAGTYQVTLTAGYAGGVTKATAPQTIDVPTSDPKSGNMVLGGKMGPGDDAYWTHFVVNGNNMVIDETKGVMTANESGYNAGAIAQPLNLVAGQKYMVDMIVSGSGATDTWFEVWVGTTPPPTDGKTDYNSGPNPIALNTWNGCGGSAFNGKLSALSCAGTGDPFTVPTTGTYYLVIKCGGSNTGVTGISFTNVTLRPVN